MNKISHRAPLDKLVIAAGGKSSEENYWLKQFTGEFTGKGFPYESGKSTSLESNVEPVDFRLSGKWFERLLELINHSDVRLYIVLLSALIVLVHKYTGSRDVILGAPIYKQEKEVNFINTVLPLRNRLDPGWTFKELLLQVGKVLFQAVENQNYPMETLLYQLNIPFSTGDDFPLFDTAVLLENIHDKVYIQHINVNMRFSFLRTGEALQGTVEYNALRYEKTFIAQITGHLQNLLAVVLHHIDTRVMDIDILSHEEKKRILFDYNNTGTGYPVDENGMPVLTIHGLFESQVRTAPDQVALMEKKGKKGTVSHDAEPHPETMKLIKSFCGGSRGAVFSKRAPLVAEGITYRELEERSRGLARGLKERGVWFDDIVGIMMDHSIETIVGILGILKAGGAYLPIDPGYPPDRIDFMLNDSRAKTVLTDREIDNLSFSPGIWDLEIGISPGQGGQLAYIIYTSGTTGKPKGVMVEHRGLVNYIYWAAGHYIKNKPVVFPLYTSLCFDLTVTSIFTPLITGNTVFIYRGNRGENLIKEVIEENREVEMIVKLTPSHLKLIRETVFSRGKGPGNIACFIVGGEALAAGLARDINNYFNGEVEIYNEYGPTETVVGSMIHRFDPLNDRGDTVPLGVPIANTKIYLLDGSRNPVPPGATGEIYISGFGVSRGYLNNPELTNSKFQITKYRSYRSYKSYISKKLYKTGDLARRRCDGAIEFLGRIDQQVKIRGYRVELAEIENNTRNFRRVKAPGVFQGQDSREVNRCRACLLPMNYPGIRFDETGICSVCREYEAYKEYIDNYFKDKKEFERIVGEAGAVSKGKYDCLLLFSGGKDSSYVLYRLVEMGLRVLAFTFDNGYISRGAFDNIKRITSSLGVDHIVDKSAHMNRVFVESLKSDYNVCHGCWNALNTFGVKAAHENKINLVISGLSRGQIFHMRLQGLFQRGIFAEKEIEENLRLFRESFHSKNNKFSRILGVEIPGEVLDSIYFVDFFRYFDETGPGVRDYLERNGWVQPGDTGFCSSNCRINDVGIYVYLREKGHHFYAAPLSWDCRLGVISRDQGLKELVYDPRPGQMEKILKEIGYDDALIKDAVVLVKETGSQDKILCAYIVSNGEIDVVELKNYLAGQLPHYMIPQEFILLKEMPLTANGKIDREALSSMGTRLSSGVQYAPPGSKTETMIAGIWKEVLKINEVGIHDNFFDLGGTSLDAILVNGRIHEMFNRDIPMVAMYKYNTIALLSGFLDKGEGREGDMLKDRRAELARGRLDRNKRLETRKRIKT